ncbi:MULTISPECIES: DUF6126 family protein [unclassified Streptomyces]|uniref:DUF6126 family protein n=1 Tax=unclassified Streptomyces TaxID=2593676 RepID=UPI0004C9CBD2|nr:DUF6126 family protein [Streptomyces sp. NRRL F-5630]
MPEPEYPSEPAGRAATEEPRAAEPLSSHAQRSSQDPQSSPEDGSLRRFVEDKIPTGLWVRVFVYVVAAHGVAAFLYLLFVLGAKNQ